MPYPYGSKVSDSDEDDEIKNLAQAELVLQEILLEDAWLEYARFNISQLRGIIPTDTIYKKLRD